MVKKLVKIIMIYNYNFYDTTNTFHTFLIMDTDSKTVTISNQDP